VGLAISEVAAKSILTRTGGYLKPVCSHSLQPYRGCSLGASLCGVGCYVRHNPWITRGRPWGSFLEVRRDAARLYTQHQQREARWARKSRGSFSIFCASSTEPFPPQERRLGVTRAVLAAMLRDPPDVLILQSHTDGAVNSLDLLRELRHRTDLRVHVSIESDRDRLPGLPPSACSVARRFDAATLLRENGIRVVVTVAPLLPIADPVAFFERIAKAADAVVLDHFIGGDGTADGRRTLATPLPQAMRDIDASSVDLGYRERMVREAWRAMPGRVGVGQAGFAGQFLRDLSVGV